MKKYISLAVVFSFGLTSLAVFAANFDVTGKLKTTRKFKKENPDIELGKKATVSSEFESGLSMDLNIDGQDLLLRVDVPEGFNDGNVSKKFKDSAGFEILDQDSNVLFDGEAKVTVKKTNQKKNFTKMTYKIKKLVTMPVKFQNADGSGGGDPPNPFPGGPIPDEDELSSSILKIIENNAGLSNEVVINTALNVFHTLVDIGLGEDVTIEEQFLSAAQSDFFFLGLQGFMNKYLDDITVDGNNCVFDVKKKFTIFGDVFDPPFFKANKNTLRMLTDKEISSLPNNMGRKAIYDPIKRTVEVTFVVTPEKSPSMIAVMEIGLSEASLAFDAFELVCNEVKS